MWDQHWQERWAGLAAELVHQQRLTLEDQFSTGLRHIEEACRLPQANTVGEMQQRTAALCRKMMETMRQTQEAQFRNYQSAAARCAELMMKWLAAGWAAT